MNIDISKLMPNKPVNEEELKTVQERHRQIIAENRENERKRKARNHRLCVHGSIMEHFFPETIDMDESQFTDFMCALSLKKCS